MLARLSEAMLQLRPVTLMFQQGLQALSCEVEISLPKEMCDFNVSKAFGSDASASPCDFNVSTWLASLVLRG